MNVIIDSNIYISWMRAQQDIPVLLRPWIVRGECFVSGIIRAEVLRGIINARQRDRMGEIFDVMNEAQLGSAFWRRVAQQAWNLDRIGVTLPLQDIAIAQSAIDCNATVITQDRHFQHIPNIDFQDRLPEN